MFRMAQARLCQPGALGAAFAAGGLAGAAYWGSTSWLSPVGTAYAEKAPTNFVVDKAASALSPDEWRAFQLKEVTPMTPDTSRFRFALPSEQQVLGLTVASCLVTRAPIGEPQPDGSKKWVIRPYTPTSLPDSPGHFDLVIKVYEKGLMSKHIGELKVGEPLECKGPIPKLPYKPNMKKSIGMV